MPPKRKSEESHATRDKKKIKVAAARTIALQSQAVDQPVAGSSSSIRKNSMQGLPSTLDVEKFAEARSFEIRAMQNAMKNSKDSSSQRSWQQLPRHLRRRAASHDVRRVPLRLRGKARAEIDSVKKKPSSSFRPKRGKAKSISRTESLLKRQQNKLWLESHLWHSKRMHMEDIWGYRLAITPAEKSFRPSHRASIHGSILHDASYFSLIELQGPQHILKRLLEFCCEPLANPASAKYLTGARMCDTHIYKAESYPFDLIAPITVLWRPVEEDEPSVLPTGGLSKSKGKHKNKAKVKEGALPSATEKLELFRTVWIQSHPSVWDDVFTALQISASFSLEWVKKSPGGVQKDYRVELIDLRQHVNVFEIMGPKSNQVVRGALTAVPDDNRTEFKEFWTLLKDIQNSGQLASGMVIGLKVQDPRLNFPPKNATAKFPEDLNILRHTHSFPSSKLARSEVWDKDLLAGIKNPRYKKKDLDERRSKNTIPGTALPPQREDDRIPILLVQRSLRNSSQSLHGWTLIVPAGWSMPFLSSLVYTGTRIAGQRERQTQSFEAGLPYFPRDYPSTEQYTTYSKKREEEEKAEWERKPPAKRVNHEKMGTRSPWKPDWKVVLGLQTTEDSDLVSSQRDIGDVRPWLLRGPAVPLILNNIRDMFNPSAGLLAEINRLRIAQHNDPLRASFRADDLWDGALVLVRLDMIGRGCPDDFSMIYQLEDNEWMRWKQSEQKVGTAQMSLDDMAEDQLQFSHTSSPIIGYVTTGHYSLSIGRGHAIGAVPLKKFLDIQRQAERMGETIPRVKTRNKDSMICRVADIELLDK